MEEKKRIVDQYKISKKIAIGFAIDWINTRLKDYVEPLRSGTPKGELIGFSRKKYYTALMMVLYPHCYKNLKEIGKLTGTSQGVIAVWRTQPQFMEIVKEERKKYGTHLAEVFTESLKKSQPSLYIWDKWRDGVPEKNIIEYEKLKKYSQAIDEKTIEREVKFQFNLSRIQVFMHVDSFLAFRKKLSDNLMGEKSLLYAQTIFGLYKSAFILRENGIKEFYSDPLIISHTKANIRFLMDIITKKSQLGKISTQKDIEMYSEALESLMFFIIDAMAK